MGIVCELVTLYMTAWLWIYSSNSFLFTNLLVPTYSTKGQFGSRSMLEILLIPILLNSAASGIVKAIFWYIGTLGFSVFIIITSFGCPLVPYCFFINRDSCFTYLF